MNRTDSPNFRKLLARWMAPSKPLPIRRRVRVRLILETLEDRATPATFTVTTNADTGAGSLRDAITQANAATTDDVIVFDTAGKFATPQTITISSALPAIAN